MVYLKPTKWRPLNGALSSRFITWGEKAVTKERLNIPFIQWGIFALILGGEIDGALTPLFHMCMWNISAHHIHTLWTLWCIFSTLQFIFVPIIIYKYTMLLGDKLNIGRIGWRSRGPDWFGPIGEAEYVNRCEGRPVRCRNREAVGKIFREEYIWEFL